MSLRIPSRIPVPTRTITVTFERKKLVTPTKMTKKSVTLKGDIFDDTTTVTAEHFHSPSDRTLSEILTLSYPETSRYSVESVRAGWGKGGKVVTYSRPESTEAELLNEVETLKRAAEFRAGDLQRAVAQNEESKRLLETWQAVNLITHAFGSFAWGYISGTDQAELNRHGMYNFVELVYKKSGEPCPAKRVASRVFNKLPSSIRDLAFDISAIKRGASDGRHPLVAHPVVTNERIRELLRYHLHDGMPGLHALEVAALEHIKSTANTASNILAASGRH